MNIVIFGASGRMGHLLVQQALDHDHEVVAYVRDATKLRIIDTRLRVVVGTLDDDTAIEQATRSADAVIEGVGAVSDGTRRIVAAMQRTNVRRLVAVSTCSVPDPADLPDLKFKALVAFVKTAAPGPYGEIRRAAELVRASGLDWTLVRVARLGNGPATGRIKTGHYGHGIVDLSITRADMAAFLLAQVTDRTYLNQAPAISN
ncbi:NAD(P)-dependent oxidoreductase [Bradyrhizobium prioriisuperbiae]|uniref:NAD(P)-dependent oxidoreductase n=1 Tax=Bradyrhizobium prioriisuperbiae TaxID=2854389 RepID=UPI0028E30DE6|nr:NAD(P)H-binding protein [Bradyrhizobium prioritasuperba]